MRHVTYFTDCYDKNAKARLKVAVHAYLGASMDLVPIKTKKMAATGMDIVDCIDAGRIASGMIQTSNPIVLINMARRELSQGAYKNGPPFCYFWVPAKAGQLKTLVVSTFTPDALALAHRLGIVNDVHLLDTFEVLGSARHHGLCNEDDVDEIASSQFRSLKFVPLVARMLLDTMAVPASERHLGDAPDPNGITLRYDNFGNVFTDLLPEDVCFEPGSTLLLESGERVKCYQHLAEVPKGELAAVIGSSGFARRQFIMLTIQGGDAQKHLKAKVGCPVVSVTELINAQASLAEIS